MAYSKVSTDRHAEEGLGLEIQRSAIDAWARANRHRVVGWCRDENVSSSNGLDTREALPAALDMLKAGTHRPWQFTAWTDWLGI